MDPVIMSALASMIAGTGMQIAQGNAKAAAANEGMKRSADARAAERGRQTAYQQEALGEARQAIGGFTPGAWQATEDAAYAGMEPQWVENATGAVVDPSRIAGQQGAPALIARNLAAELMKAREYGANNARNRARLASGDSLTLKNRADSTRTSGRIGMVNDFANSSAARLPLEQTIAGYVPTDTGGIGDLLVGGGMIGLAGKAAGMGLPTGTPPIAGWMQKGGK